MDYLRKPNTNCIVCNIPIYKRRFEILRNNGHVFCSMECYGKFSRKETPCIVCGKLIMASFNKKTCSRVCANKNRKGIKYKLTLPRKDKVSDYKSLKLRLLQERGQCCERCGYSKYEILHVHHKDRNRRNNTPENLELICPNCHYEKHYLEKHTQKSYN